MSVAPLDAYSFGPVCAVLLAVAYFDLRSRRIPNPLVLVLLLGGLAHGALGGGGRGLLLALAGAAVGMLLVALQYRAGLMGAGDVKLLGALGGWVGPLGAVVLLLLASVLGGLLALWRLLALRPSDRAQVGRNLLNAAIVGRLAQVEPTEASRRAAIPFGVAIAVAAAGLLSTGVRW